MYQSTMEVFDAAYQKVSVGGFIIVDDWGLFNGQAKRATIDFRDKCGIREQIYFVEGNAIAFWRKQRASDCG